jgi:hypothetical protein
MHILSYRRFPTIEQEGLLGDEVGGFVLDEADRVTPHPPPPSTVVLYIDRKELAHRPTP